MRVLAFGAHPDDIEIGMGGTIAKYTRKGHKVLMVVVSIPNDKKLRSEEAKDAASLLDAEILLLDIEPRELIFTRKLVGVFDNIIEDFSPDEIYTHWINDSHQDHQIVASATIAASRKNNSSLYMYEQTIPGGITPFGFKPQLFIDITESIDKKIESIRKHKTQLRKNGEWWIYGIKGRAMYRGYQINVKYAEAFEVIKEIRYI